MTPNHKKMIMPYFIGFLFMISTVVRGRFVSFPWCDELTFLDSAVTFLRTGHWHSETFYLVNNPLSPLVTAFCTSLFGYSHSVVIGVGCFFAFLAMCAILLFLRKRQILVALPAQLLFVCLYWCGATFSSIMMNGRPDTMVLLMTVLLLDQMFPADGAPPKCLRVVLFSFLLMLFAAYTLPLMVAFSMLGIFIHSSRRTVIRRTCSLVFGGILGWLTIALFYAWHHELVRFVGFYASFNSITGEKFGSFWTRVVSGFLFDKWALSLLIGSVVIGAVFHRKITRRQVCVFVVVSLIPVLMVLCGRYQYYYSWLYYVPLCIFFAWMAERSCRWLPFVLAGLVVIFWSIRMMPSEQCLQRYAHSLNSEKFIAEHEDCFDGKVDVLVADDTVGDVDFYYPLLRRSIFPWFRGKVALSELPDAKKFEVGLSMFVKSERSRDEVLSRVMRFQNVMPYLPPHGGLVLFVSNDNLAEVRPLIEHAGYALSFVASDGERSLYRMTAEVSAPRSGE